MTALLHILGGVALGMAFVMGDVDLHVSHERRVSMPCVMFALAGILLISMGFVK